jgi:hypothetical protein
MSLLEMHLFNFHFKELPSLFLLVFQGQGNVLHFGSSGVQLHQLKFQVERKDGEPNA